MGADRKEPAGALGVRVDPKETAWALVSGTAAEPILEAHDKLVPPKVLSAEPERLLWYWDQIALLIKDRRPKLLAVRYAEDFGVRGKREPDRIRARIEGVVMASAAQLGVKVFTGALKDIASAMGTKASKKYLEQDDLRGLDWSEFDDKRREAVLVATAALG
jgi:hypothetical protein